MRRDCWESEKNGKKKNPPTLQHHEHARAAYGRAAASAMQFAHTYHTPPHRIRPRHRTATLPAPNHAPDAGREEILFALLPPAQGPAHISTRGERVGVRVLFGGFGVG
jgi:hypothetical protein